MKTDERYRLSFDKDGAVRLLRCRMPTRMIPHFASAIECDCLGCHGERSQSGADANHEAPRLPPLPPLAEGASLDPSEVVKRDEPVLELFADSYLAPLLPMARSQTWEIRRGAITSLARLSDDHLRAAVSALRNLQGQSVLVDVLQYCSSPLCTSVEKREAIMGLCNLLGHKHSQSELRAENLFDGVLNLMRECQTDTSVKIMTWLTVDAVGGLAADVGVVGSVVA